MYSSMSPSSRLPPRLHLKVPSSSPSLSGDTASACNASSSSSSALVTCDWGLACCSCESNSFNASSNSASVNVDKMALASLSSSAWNTVFFLAVLRLDSFVLFRGRAWMAISSSFCSSRALFPTPYTCGQSGGEFPRKNRAHRGSPGTTCHTRP